MANEFGNQSLPVEVKFESLSPQDQAERFSQIASNYLGTVEERIKQTRMTGVTAKIAWYFAFGQLDLAVMGARHKLVDETIAQNPYSEPEEIIKVIKDFSPEKVHEYIVKSQLFDRFNPRSSPIQYFQTVRDDLKERQLSLASEIAEDLLERFPGLATYADAHRTFDSDESVKWYKRTNKLKGNRVPPYLRTLLYFRRNIFGMREWDDNKDRVRHFKNEAHTQRFQFMEQVLASALTKKQRKAVEQGVDYGNGLNLTSYSPATKLWKEISS